MTMSAIKARKLNTVSTKITDNFGETSMVSATDWENGEGFDVRVVNGQCNQFLSVSWNEWIAVSALANVLDSGGIDDEVDNA